ncbi:hypothetical protein ACQEU5_07070 [Marinactinospora thermotolerans]|uniref:hypothetical protein n=1 Tax=Marinactinospora thermotolerans TaxID=531310 RepID=UPI00099936C4|nr:hypothetical protein [Marinactinospora thermotolerans]
MAPCRHHTEEKMRARAERAARAIWGRSRHRGPRPPALLPAGHPGHGLVAEITVLWEGWLRGLAPGHCVEWESFSLFWPDAGCATLASAAHGCLRMASGGQRPPADPVAFTLQAADGSGTRRLTPRGRRVVTTLARREFGTARRLSRQATDAGLRGVARSLLVLGLCTCAARGALEGCACLALLRSTHEDPVVLLREEFHDRPPMAS